MKVQPRLVEAEGEEKENGRFSPMDPILPVLRLFFWACGFPLWPCRGENGGKFKFSLAKAVCQALGSILPCWLQAIVAFVAMAKYPEVFYKQTLSEVPTGKDGEYSEATNTSNNGSIVASEIIGNGTGTHSTGMCSLNCSIHWW